MNTKEIFQKILAGEEVTLHEKVEVAKDLIADNVANILQREIVVASLSHKPSTLTLKARECTDSDENIRRYLTILGAQNIKVTSDFPCGYGGESYEGSTTIKFNY